MLGYGADFLPLLIDAAERAGFAGLNVTHPCKQTAIAHLTALADDARALGAVNTVVLRDGARIGHNTDWWAFRESMRRRLAGRVVAPRRAARRGWRGRRDGVCDSRDGRRASSSSSIRCRRGRRRSRADSTRGSPGRVFAAAPSRDALAAADGLIHATPIGMAAHPGMALPAEWLHERLWVAEVVYFPLETALLHAARARGCRTLDGAGMAVWQAVEAFRLFTGLAADPERMRALLRRSGCAMSARLCCAAAG